jgi:hypothetical protein
MRETLSINLDRKVVGIMQKYNIKLEEVFILLALYGKKRSILEDYIRDKTLDQKIVFIQPLLRKQLIGQHIATNDNFDISNYEESATGLAAYAELKAAMDLANFATTELGKVDGQDEFDKFVLEFLALFPAGKKNDGGKTLRSHPTDTAVKLKRFIIKYKYDKETILKATKNFLEKLRGNYSYCPAATYFILKSQESALATECELVEKSGETLVNPFEKKASDWSL